MTTVTATATEADRRIRPDDVDQDQHVQLHGASWADYERLLEIRGESSVPRIAYLQGELELMSPSQRHEGVAEMISWLLGIWALERRVALQALGRTTWKERGAERGAEADACYVLGSGTKPRPDVALEVVVTSGWLDKLEVYRGLGVPEVWFWRAGSITAHVLHGQRYQQVPSSVLLPWVDLVLLARLAERRRDRTHMARLLQRLLRRR